MGEESKAENHGEDLQISSVLAISIFPLLLSPKSFLLKETPLEIIVESPTALFTFCC